MNRGAPGSELTSSDLDGLVKCYITPELAQQAGVFRVDSSEGARLVGRNGRADYSGVIFPYYWPGDDSLRETRLRRDHPEIEIKDGVPKPKGKYLSPLGRSNLFYIPPGTPAEYLSDATIRVVFTEGEKKALALYRYFTERGERVLVIGLSGAWNWRGTVGKTTDEKGARCDVKGPISDFDRIVWNKRKVLIIYDTNVTSNESVAAARTGLAKELRGRDANVQLVDLPEIEGVNGVDDLLGLKGPEFLKELLVKVESKYSGKDALDLVLQESPKGSMRERYRYFRDEVLPVLLRIEDEGERVAATDDAAKSLGLKSSDLRRILKSGADEEGDNSTGLVLHDPELWYEPVDGAVLLNDVEGVVRRFLSAPDHAYKAVALWVIYTFAFDLFDTSPLLAVVSPEKRCGKTTLLTLLSALVPRPLAIANITASALYRTVEKFRPTLLIDEADSFLTDNEELRGILNSGHRKATAYVVRTAGEDHEPRLFTTWTPKAIALIGSLPGTLEDRAVTIRLERKRANDSTERLRFDGLSQFEPLRRRAARWAEDTRETLRFSDPAIPTEITNDRARDNWRPLIAIADAAGKDWPRLAWEAALACSSVAPEAESTKVLLLRDLKAIFDEHGGRLESEKIITALIEIEGRPWAEVSHGKPLTKTGLASRLRPFGLHPKKWREGSTTVRGYEEEDFIEVFARYVESETPQTPRPMESIACEENKTPQAASSVAFQNAANLNEVSDVASVAFQDRGTTNIDTWLAESKARAEGVMLGTAVWRNSEGDQPVIVTADLGIGGDGRRYVEIQGSKAGIPLDEIEHVTPEEAAEREAILHDYYDGSNNAADSEPIIDSEGNEYHF